MNLSDIKIVVREMMWEYLEDHLTDKNCPKCKASCSMVRVSVIPEEGEEGFTNKWRCLNCLGMFTEELKESNKKIEKEV